MDKGWGSTTARISKRPFSCTPTLSFLLQRKGTYQSSASPPLTLENRVRVISEQKGTSMKSEQYFVHLGLANYSIKCVPGPAQASQVKARI